MHLSKFCIFLTFGFWIDTVRSREKKTLIVYDKPTPWQSANAVCVSLGYNLVVVDSGDVLIAMQKLKANIWSTVTGRLWTGLHAPVDNDGNRTPFKWMKECLPLDENEFQWKTSHPQAWGYCTLVDPTNQFTGEVMGCSSNYIFICEKSQGPCEFTESGTESTVTGALSTIIYDPSTETECKNHCLQTNFIEECWAITLAGSKCTLHLAKSAFYFDNKITPEAGTILFSKKCYEGLYYDFANSPTPVNPTYESEPDSHCNSSSTQLTVIEKYNLAPNYRRMTVIRLFEDTLNRANALQRCRSNSGDLVYIDQPLQQLIDNQLLVWTPSTNMWIGVTDTGWDSGQAITFKNDEVFTATALNKQSGKWLSEQLTSENQFICQHAVGECTFKEIKDMAISSAISDSNVTLDICKGRCKDYVYGDNDCWAVSYSAIASTCLYHFSSNPEIALDTNVVVDGLAYGLSLYRKVCYTFNVTAQTSLSSSSSQVETASSLSSLPASSSYAESSSPEYSHSTSSSIEAQASSLSPISDSAVSPSSSQTQSSSSYLDSASPTTESLSLAVVVKATPSSASSNLPTPVINSTEPPITSNIDNVTQYDNKTCLCVCNRATLELDSAELAEKLKVISSELFVDPKEVSASKRKYISVEDPRPSARAVGGVLGITTLCLVFGFLILLDVQKVVTWLVEYVTTRTQER